MKWTTRNIRSQTGRRVVITGANSGIGFHAALELVRKSVEVILPARTNAKAADAIQRIRAEYRALNWCPAVLDLASLRSVRTFCRFHRAAISRPSIDLLINNARVMALPTRELTEHGFERKFATKLPGAVRTDGTALPASEDPDRNTHRHRGQRRVHTDRIDFDNLQSERKYAPFSGTYA